MNTASRWMIFGALLATPILLLADSGGPPNPGGPACWVPVWQNNTCTGTCGGTYTICPGRTRCSWTTTGGKNLGPLVNLPVTCEDYIGGTGTCNVTTSCTGGVLAIPQTGTIVVVSTQTCPGTCP